MVGAKRTYGRNSSVLLSAKQILDRNHPLGPSYEYTPRCPLPLLRLPSVFGCPFAFICSFAFVCPSVIYRIYAWPICRFSRLGIPLC